MFDRVWTKVRGLLGLGAVGGVAGAVGGALLSVGGGLLGLWGGVQWGSVLELALGGAFFTSIGAMVFGGALVALESRKSVEELPIWRMAAFGVLIGVGLTLGFVALMAPDAFSYAPEAVAVLTAASGLVVIVRMYETLHRRPSDGDAYTPE